MLNRQHMYYQLAIQFNTMRQHTLTHCAMLLIKLLPAAVKGLSRKDSRQNIDIGSISKVVTISQQRESVKQLGFQLAQSRSLNFLHAAWHRLHLFLFSQSHGQSLGYLL